MECRGVHDCERDKDYKVQILNTFLRGLQKMNLKLFIGEGKLSEKDADELRKLL